jgi:hypothetical protein
MAESDVHTVATAADNPNRAERLHDATAKLHPMTVVTVAPVEADVFEAS